ncbi:NADH:flavin oxidoreductase/NADH oxidase [Fulvimarina pelagi HTCC2506]|uniref:NADH:flavin oxidoreductase/NADH oxidase n=1 Tax=Fulvimarina pelagi HTCC2506 TaxID=314231 RepID=Q0G6F0_9HYPH|nr:alkene reductase [Fulvimarina pelagi]EAU42764.1 NADH:flavin oxidoreductase/NADH oxidase [Fulvimarina pelagi HTCC2506]
MATQKLFEPYNLGPNTLSNRIVMAPLTRSRADDTDTPKDMHVVHYRQRASAGLIISEATQISNEGKGYAWTPGIYSDEQVAAWKRVTDAVHAEGGKIFMQLWHVGRISHPDLQHGGRLPVSASAIQPDQQAFTETGFKPIPTPRALETDELPRVIADYVKAAENAKAAGFDGVEVHSANGYLLDQFLQDSTNKRTDAYGGSIENRMRFPLEVIDAVVKVWGADRVGVRVSPGSGANDMADSDPEALFLAYAKELGQRKLAYLHVIEGLIWQDRDKEDVTSDKLRDAFGGTYMGNNQYTREIAIERAEIGQVDLACFGRPFIANPDLVERLKLDAPLNEPDKDTFYGGDEKGYIDYPFLSEEEKTRFADAA